MSTHLLDQHPDTLLSPRELGLLIRRAHNTMMVDATRRPESLPAITRIGRNIFYRVGDVKEYLASRRTPRPESLRDRVKKELRAK